MRLSAPPLASTLAAMLAPALLAGCAAEEPDTAAEDAGLPDVSGDDGDNGSDGGDGTGGSDDPLEEQLRALVAAQDHPPAALLPPPEQDPALVALGEALFFDPLLSGNRDIACATCHFPTLGTSDGLPLSVGTGGVGQGPDRATGDYPGFVPRHALDLFSRADPLWTRLFWDARVEADAEGRLRTPLGEDLPAGLSSPLAAQALFPLLDRVEMLGQPGDTDAGGRPNELALLDAPAEVFAGIVARVEAQAGYAPLLAEAAGDGPVDIALLANALAAWQAASLSLSDTPWDAWLEGDAAALNDTEKLGAIVFFGDGGCAACHSGPLLTDQQTHVTGVPQWGPGMPDSALYDLGRADVTGFEPDRFAFRTPPLRNVALTAPYMHTGIYATLEQAVLHYTDPINYIDDLDRDAMHPDLRGEMRRNELHKAELEERLSELMLDDDDATVGLSNVRVFLEALTDPAAEDLRGLVPESVPSGLTVGGAR